MRYNIIIIVTLLFLGSSFARKYKQESIVPKILHQMYDSIKSIKTLRQDIKALERIDAKYVSANSEIKLLNHPKKIYFINRDKKLEILYDAELFAHKAYVKPHVFPYMTLLLDPSGNIMRKNQHYTILELGYDFIGKSIALTISKDKEGLKNFTYHGKVQKNGYTCYFIEYENKSYNYVNYTVGEKETASLIAYKLCVNDYLLRNKNDLLNEFGYLKKGRILKVPNLYCKRAILYIDETLCLPVAISLYDDKGLFESYEYTNIQINKPFALDDFKKENKAYGF